MIVESSYTIVDYLQDVTATTALLLYLGMMFIVFVAVTQRHHSCADHACFPPLTVYVVTSGTIKGSP